MKQPSDEIDSLVQEKDAFDQSIALNRIAMALLKNRREETFWLHLVLLISILVNIAIAGLFLVYETHMQTTTTTTTVTQDTGEGDGNNVYQAGEHAIYEEGTEK